MADDTSSPTSGSQGGSRGGQRPAGNREPGGFRIRLSDNEMRAARAVQEAFHLRSTVAALGFSIRTVAQLLDEGKLDALVAEQRAQAGPRPDRGERRGGGGRSDRPSTPRIDPFARPSKPAAAAAPAAEEAESTPAPESAVEAESAVEETHPSEADASATEATSAADSEA